jgi:hypothetical protein
MFFIACVQLIAGISAFAQAEKQPVDRLLVLAMDVSISVNQERFSLQIKGCAEAFRDANTIKAITSGPHGSVVITMAQWDGWGEYVQTVPWTTIRNIADGRRFADAIEQSGRVYMEATSISWAILSSAKLIDEAPYSAPRSVIDISGDGPDDTEHLENLKPQGAPPTEQTEKLRKRYLDKAGTTRFVLLPEARNKVCGAGIEINGLAIEGADDVEDLTSHYRNHVICRKGGFVVRVENPDSYEEFSQAIMRKIRHELSF